MDYQAEIVTLISNIRSERYLKYIYELIKTLMDDSI
jgi:hypothetical protein